MTVLRSVALSCGPECCASQLSPPAYPLFCPQFRNPKASLRIRLCDLLSHLQQRGERHCQEFYRALYIHAQPLHSHLPSRYTPRKSCSLSLPVVFHTYQGRHPLNCGQHGSPQCLRCPAWVSLPLPVPPLRPPRENSAGWHGSASPSVLLLPL